MQKLIRITTVPISLAKLLKGQLRFMTSTFKVLAVSSKGSFNNDVELNEGVPVITIEMTRAITPFRDLFAVWQLWILFKKERPFIVHTHTPKAGTVGMIAARLAGVKHRLHTVAGLPLLEAKGSKRAVLNLVEKLTYRCATKVYPNSFGLKDVILKHKFTDLKKLKVIGNGSSNGVDTEFFNPNLFSEIEKNDLKQDLGIDLTQFVYIFIGRVVGDKGINELIKAFQNAQFKDSKLIVVGPFEPELDPLDEETLDAIHNNPNIIFVGYQNDVRKYLAISDALVFPSYREGFPNVVMQAGSMGLPCIVSNINGCNEIIEEGINGTIIPVKDSESILKAMLKIKENDSWRNSLKAQARSIIVTRYEQRYVWQEILREYLKLEQDV